MSIRLKLWGLLLFITLILALFAGYTIRGSLAIQRSVRFFIPATQYLQGIAEARGYLTRQSKEVRDFLISGDQEDLDEFKHFGALVDASFAKWIDAIKEQQGLGVEGEADDLELAEEIRDRFRDWQTLTGEVFDLAKNGKWDEAVLAFDYRLDPLLDNQILIDIDTAFRDGQEEVEEAYLSLLTNVSRLPWISGESSENLEMIQATLKYFVAVNRTNVALNKQSRCLADLIISSNERDLQLFFKYGTDVQDAVQDWLKAQREKIALGESNPAEYWANAVTFQKNYRQAMIVAERAISLKRQENSEEAILTVKDTMERLLDESLLPRIGQALQHGSVEISRLAGSARWQGVTLIVVLSLLIVFGTLRLIQSMLNPLRQIKSGMVAITQGRLDQRINLQSQDELGDLAQAFDHMAENLQSSQQEVERLHADLEQRVMDRTAQLEMANQELEAFSYSVSHDLRSPLMLISGLSQILHEDCRTKLSSQDCEALLRIEEATRRMNQIIEALLELSQVSRSELKREIIDFTALAETTCRELSALSSGRHVEWHVTPGLRIFGDRDLLSLALRNLLENAWKYTAKQPAAVVEVGGRNEHGQAVYYVRDNGVGFAVDTAEELFRPFKRLHDKKDFSGSGIGLATVDRIVRRHGGRIWAEGAEGEGATFFFTVD